MTGDAPPRRSRATDARTATAFLLTAALVLAGCTGDGADGGGRGSATPGGDTTCDGRIDGTSQITVWYHSPTAQGELTTLRTQVRRFNASQHDVKVTLMTLPDGDYDAEVRAAAAGGGLPDLLDFDAPKLLGYAWAGRLRPLGSCLPDALRADLLPSILQQGTYAGRLWGIGTFDSGLGLYVRPSVLKRAGVRIPQGTADAWTAEEFTGILRKLREEGYEAPLDLGLRYSTPGAEWNTYGFAPAVWSAGGDLIDPKNHRTADGYLNGADSVRALTVLRTWVGAGLVDPGADDRAFTAGRSPISWSGHWRWREYAEAFPGDITIVPLPDFGHGTVTGMGSWQWAVPANGADPDAVWRFLAFLLSPDEVVRMTDVNGAIPATRTATERTAQFRGAGPERLYIEQLQNGTARPRPRTPAYGAVSDAFSRAFAKIVLDGAPVGPTLDRAVAAIDKDLADHRYYPPTGR
ncbi:ABC transporter substrate-binding protein [Streptomyces sp. NPDC088794]|uniref:ABC transporter substrate-binding protein n=1 Tax=Streptomyces sp. NPDC088794 TaxID=3365902 RepID=UPI0037FA0B16